MKYKTAIHEKRDYIYPKSSVFQEGDFTWRDFSSEYVPFLLNWILKFGQENVPQKLLQVNTCLRMLYMCCDEMYKYIKELLRLTQSKNIEEFFFKCSRKKTF